MNFRLDKFEFVQEIEKWGVVYIKEKNINVKRWCVYKYEECKVLLLDFFVLWVIVLLKMYGRNFNQLG